MALDAATGAIVGGVETGTPSRRPCSSTARTFAWTGVAGEFQPFGWCDAPLHGSTPDPTGSRYLDGDPPWVYENRGAQVRLTPLMDLPLLDGFTATWSLDGARVALTDGAGVGVWRAGDGTRMAWRDVGRVDRVSLGPHGGRVAWLTGGPPDGQTIQVADVGGAPWCVAPAPHVEEIALSPGGDGLLALGAGRLTIVDLPACTVRWTVDSAALAAPI